MNEGDEPIVAARRPVRRAVGGELAVFTFKEGALARAAHDLKLALEEFEIVLEGDELTGSFALDTLKVEGPVRAGRVRPDEFDSAQRRDVEELLRREVLHTARHPLARFSGRATARPGGFVVTGELSLAGVTAPLTFEVESEGTIHRGRFSLQPSRWGIAPYRALLGAIRVKDEVHVAFALREAT